jgi:hypothetical protein
MSDYRGNPENYGGHTGFTVEFDLKEIMAKLPKGADPKGVRVYVALYPCCPQDHHLDKHACGIMGAEEIYVKGVEKPKRPKKSGKS